MRGRHARQLPAPPVEAVRRKTGAGDRHREGQIDPPPKASPVRHHVRWRVACARSSERDAEARAYDSYEHAHLHAESHADLVDQVVPHNIGHKLKRLDGHQDAGRREGQRTEIDEAEKDEDDQADLPSLGSPRLREIDRVKLFDAHRLNVLADVDPYGAGGSHENTDAEAPFGHRGACEFGWCKRSVAQQLHCHARPRVPARPAVPARLSSAGFGWQPTELSLSTRRKKQRSCDFPVISSYY